MKISQFKYFTTLAELQNVSKAAELLHVSQSSLSKNILAIESELNVTLFDRNGKHLVLNSAGQRFLECCHKIIREYESTMDDIRVMSTGTGNRIRIGACGSINRLLPVMTSFKADHPETEYDINTEIENDDFIDINVFDALIYPDEAKFHRFNGYHLFDENYYLAVSKNSPLKQEAAINSRLLQGLDVVFLRNGQSNEHAYNVCTALSIKFASQSFVTSRAFQHDAVEAGLAVGFVPDSYKSLYSASDKIKLIPIVDNNFTRKYNICFKRKKHLGQLARDFEEYIISSFELSDKE